jgi:hypothetical protein
MTTDSTNDMARSDVGSGAIDRRRGITCSSTDFAMRDRFARAEGVRLSSSSNGLASILGLTSREGWLINRSHAWDDHGDVWHRDRRPIVYTSQPYGEPPRDVLDALTTRFALDIDVRPPSESWYYPGATSLVIFRATQWTRDRARQWVRDSRRW